MGVPGEKPRETQGDTTTTRGGANLIACESAALSTATAGAGHSSLEENPPPFLLPRPLLLLLLLTDLRAEHLAVDCGGAVRSPGCLRGQPQAPCQPQAPAAGRRRDRSSCGAKELCGRKNKKQREKYDKCHRPLPLPSPCVSFTFLTSLFMRGVSDV